MAQHTPALLRSTATWIAISSMCNGLPGRISTGLLFIWLHGAAQQSVAAACGIKVLAGCVHLMKSLFCQFASSLYLWSLSKPCRLTDSLSTIKVSRIAFFNSTSHKNLWNPVKLYQQSEPGVSGWSISSHDKAKTLLIQHRMSKCTGGC